MIVIKSMHEVWRSNSYLVADKENGYAVFIDAGAPIDLLLKKAEELNVSVTHILITHEHEDHVQNLAKLQHTLSAQTVLPAEATDRLELHCGELTFRALETPGHCSPHIAWFVEQTGNDDPAEVFTGDLLFKGSVGGTLHGGANGLSQLRESITKLLSLPDTTIIRPGHSAPSTIAIEKAENVFIRAWNSEVALENRSITVRGEEATLLLMGPDYDDTSKAWVRFHNKQEAIVGGSMVSYVSHL